MAMISVYMYGLYSVSHRWTWSGECCSTDLSHIELDQRKSMLARAQGGTIHPYHFRRELIPKLVL